MVVSAERRKEVALGIRRLRQRVDFRNVITSPGLRPLRSVMTWTEDDAIVVRAESVNSVLAQRYQIEPPKFDFLLNLPQHSLNSPFSPHLHPSLVQVEMHSKMRVSCVPYPQPSIPPPDQRRAESVQILMSLHLCHRCHALPTPTLRNFHLASPDLWYRC